MKIVKGYKKIQFVQEVPVIQIDANWCQMWKYKRAYKKMIKNGK